MNQITVKEIAFLGSYELSIQAPMSMFSWKNSKI